MRKVNIIFDFTKSDDRTIICQDINCYELKWYNLNDLYEQLQKIIYGEGDTDIYYKCIDIPYQIIDMLDSEDIFSFDADVVFRFVDGKNAVEMTINEVIDWMSAGDDIRTAAELVLNEHKNLNGKVIMKDMVGNYIIRDNEEEK